MRRLLLVVVLALCPFPAFANARITVLMEVLRIPEVIAIFREEGLAGAQDLDADLLDGRGGAFLAAQVRQIYDADAIAEKMRHALETGLDAEDVEAVIAFFAIDPGARIIALENAARRAMADPAVDAAARARFAEAAADDPKARLVSRFIEVNDLLERNVAGVMSANLRFYSGLADGGYTDQRPEEIVADVWDEQEAIRADTDTWLGGFLFMAYDPLPADALETYLAFAEAPAGQALNAALFDGFETVYRDVSYALGRAVALSAGGEEL